MKPVLTRIVGLAATTVAFLTAACGGTAPKSQDSPTPKADSSVLQLKPGPLIDGQQTMDGTDKEQIFGSGDKTILIGEIPAFAATLNDLILVNAGAISETQPVILANGKPIKPVKIINNFESGTHFAPSNSRYLVSSNDLVSTAKGDPEVKLTVATRDENGKVEIATEEITVGSTTGNSRGLETYSGLNRPATLTPGEISILKGDFGL